MDENDDLARFIESIKPLPKDECTCLKGTSIIVTDPWCPQHRTVWEYISKPEQESE